MKMKEEEKETIIQLMPAIGFRAIYAVKEEDKISLVESPLVCFALVEYGEKEENKMRIIHPMDSSRDGEVDFANDNQNFLGILNPQEKLVETEWMETAKKFAL